MHCRIKAFCPIVSLVPACLPLAFVLLFVGKAGMCIKLSTALSRLASQRGRTAERLSFSLVSVGMFWSWIVFSQSWRRQTNQLPFSGDESEKRQPQTAIKKNKNRIKQRKNEGSDCEASFCWRAQCGCCSRGSFFRTGWRFTWKAEHSAALNSFFGENVFSRLAPAGDTAAHHGPPSGSDNGLVLTLGPVGSLELLPAHLAAKNPTDPPWTSYTEGSSNPAPSSVEWAFPFQTFSLRSFPDCYVK